MSSPDKRYSILIVDDNTDLLEALTGALTRIGPFAVTVATDGDTGLDQFFSSRPDCVIIDVKMPGLDGYQLVRALRGDQASADVPLIMLTAMAQDKDQYIGLASGADRYLVKPVTPQELATQILDAITTGDAERHKRMHELADTEDTDPTY